MSKSLILLRGVPGCGKSTMADLLSENGKYPIFSVDDYFTDSKGKYEFDYSKNHLAYKSCEENTRHAMEQGISKVLVHNTFIFEWEMKPYFDLANLMDYRIFSLIVEKYHNNENIHSISESDIEKMALKLKAKLF